MITSVAQIVRDPNISGGDPTVAGTRVCVHTLVGFWKANGSDLAVLERNYPRLTRQQLECALEFYAQNRAEIDGYLEDERQFVIEWHRNRRNSVA